jgi:LPXTG-motif cell wall-anchored protein
MLSTSQKEDCMRTKGFLLAVVALGGAALCFAQNPGGNYSTAPTNKDYRLNIKEPVNGATITGTEVQIVINTPWVADSNNVNQKERKDVMTPTFQIWVDGKNYGNLPTGQNVFIARDLAYGEHAITVAAKNISGELVDRQEIKVTTVASKVAVSTTNQAPPPPAPVAAQPAPVAAPPPPAAVPPPPEPAPMAALPQTGTAYPGALAGGLGLVLAGLALSRRRRA